MKDEPDWTGVLGGLFLVVFYFCYFAGIIDFEHAVVGMVFLGVMALWKIAS